jgi:hypothetical protein
LTDAILCDLVQHLPMRSLDNGRPARLSLGQQAFGILRLDTPTYRDVVQERSTGKNSLVILLTATALSAVGLMFSSDSKVEGLVKGALGVLVGWIIPALVIPLLTQLIAKQKLAVSTAFRLTGFTSMFAFGGVLGLIPGVGIIGVAAGAILAPVGNSVGIREAIKSSMKRAVMIAFVAAFIEVGVAEVLDRILSPILN